LSESYTEKVKKLGEEVTKYRKYGLSDNPFPSKAIFTDWAPNIAEILETFCWEIRKEEILEIHDKLIEEAYYNQKSTNVWLQGEVGVGKSSILIYMWKQLQTHRSDVVALYSELGSGFPYVYERVIAQLGRDFFRNLVLKLAATVVLKSPELFLKKDDPIIEELKKDALSIEKYLGEVETEEADEEEKGKIDINQVSNVLQSELNQLGVTTKLRDCLVKMLKDPYAGYNELFAKIASTQRRKALGELFRVFKFAGYRMSYLFLDQLDFMWRNVFKKAQQDRIVQELRQFANETLGYVSIATTTYPDLTPIFESQYPHLKAALPITKRKIVDIKPLDAQEAKIMTTKYLEKVKTNESIPGLYPFTEQAIDFICEYRGGLPRDMLVDLHDILDEAVEQCVKIIDVDFVKKYYEVQEKEREKRPVPSKGTAEEKVKKPRIEVKFEDITKTE
jgi:hypothetical protein